MAQAWLFYWKTLLEKAAKKPSQDLIDFVIYRPDVLYDKLRKDIVEPGPELDKIKKIKRMKVALLPIEF